MKTQAFNPYLPSYEYVPDGEPRVFGDRLYVYGSHDIYGSSDFCLGDYVCWSAPLDDLGDWRYEGVIYRRDQDPKNRDKKQHMNAPDCVQGSDGRYYLYYQLHLEMGTQVAVCDTPAGKFEYYGDVRYPDGTVYGKSKKDSFGFDPGVLVDGGRVFLYTGFSPKPSLLKFLMSHRGGSVEGGYCTELEQDMVTVKGTPVLVIPGYSKAKGTGFEGHAFYEASSPRKINGKYYMVYSSILSHELCYAISDHPDRDYKYGGTVISIADIGYKGNTVPTNYTGNTHGGLAEINGQWYIFYHRQTNRVKHNRQGCAEKITILPDGSIPQVETTSCGLNDGPLRAAGTYEARIACNLSGRNGTVKSDDAKKLDKNMELPYFTQTGGDRENDPDQFIANMKEGSWCGFKYFVFTGQERSIFVKGLGDGKFTVSTDQAGCETVADVPVNGGAPLNIVPGIYTLFFTYHGKDSSDFISFTIE